MKSRAIPLRRRRRRRRNFERWVKIRSILENQIDEPQIVRNYWKVWRSFLSIDRKGKPIRRMFSWKIAKFFLEQEIEQDIKKKTRRYEHKSWKRIISLILSFSKWIRWIGRIDKFDRFTRVSNKRSATNRVYINRCHESMSRFRNGSCRHWAPPLTRQVHRSRCQYPLHERTIQ